MFSKVIKILKIVVLPEPLGPIKASFSPSFTCKFKLFNTFKSPKDLKLPKREKLPQQGAMFVGEKGKLLLPHFMELPRLIVDGEYKEIDITPFEKSKQIGAPIRNYEQESPKHYHQFVDACLDKGTCTAPFSYSAKLTETILLGVIAGRFPNKTLNWDKKASKFLTLT